MNYKKSFIESTPYQIQAIILPIASPNNENQWYINGCNLSKQFFLLQANSAQLLESNKLPLEESVFEIM